jgi:hypothetical protein
VMRTRVEEVSMLARGDVSERTMMIMVCTHRVMQTRIEEV